MAQIDKRLNRFLAIKAPNMNAADGTNTMAYRVQVPFGEDSKDGDGTYNSDYIVNSYSMLGHELAAMSKDGIDDDTKKIIEKLKSNEKNMQGDQSGAYKGTASIMNPFAFTRLYGAKGGAFLTDKRNRRKYYEIDGNDDGHYAKNPTTGNIMKWGSQDKYGRHTYQWQDFIFSKYWNIIPNNRLITLRRFTQPTYDNLNFPTMDDAASVTIHPVATAVTYFGDGTENTLSDILAFSAAMNWEPAEGDIWDTTGNAPSMEELNKATGWDKFFGTGIVNASTVLGLIGNNVKGQGNENFDANAAKGLPPDPYYSGAYTNRVLGPLNCINKVWKRKRGLEFKMDNLKLNFDYVSRPFNGWNTKAVLLDILSNFLVMGYASGVWWGGSHRFHIQPAMYPFNDEKARQALWSGKVLGKDGAAQVFVNNFKEKLSSGLSGAGGSGVGNIFKNLADTAASLMGDLMGAMGLGDTKVGEFLTGRGDKNNGAKNMANNVSEMVASTIQARIGPLPYLNNMKSILTGEPVGDWHLVIGNPMNPIAEIGNLICKDIEIKFSDELGPDDFPIGFRATITLAHGMGRDRDGIEAMFNKGAGRIYELPDKYSSSADGQTKVDKVTDIKGYGGYNWQSVPKVPAASTWSQAGGTDNTHTETQRDAYVAVGIPGFVPSTLNVRSALRNQDTAIVHHIMPWQTKIVL